MRVTFFRKCSKFNVDLKNEEKMEKKHFVFEINASELFALNFLHEEENTCHWQSICSQKVL